MSVRRAPAVAILVMVGVAIGLSGCGKKGAPSPPGPADQIHYPRVYPAQ